MSMETREEKMARLEAALREAVENPTNENLFGLIVTAVSVHRQGSGLVWEETKAIVAKVVPPA